MKFLLNVIFVSRSLRQGRLFDTPADLTTGDTCLGYERDGLSNPVVAFQVDDTNAAITQEDFVPA
jgi:hypothetical protein